MLYDPERWHYEDEIGADGHAHAHTRACWFSFVLYDHARWYYEDEFNADGYAHAREPVGFDLCSTITSAGIMKMSSVPMRTHTHASLLVSTRALRSRALAF